MSDSVESLIEVLEKSESIYQQLLPVFQQEKRATLSSEPDTFSAIIVEKEALLAQLRQLDRQRHLILHQISAVWNIPVNDLRLSTVADKLEGSQSAQIRNLRLSLNGLVEKIKRSNEENRLLIQHCLDIVQGTLGFFHQMVMPKDVYGASGQMSVYNGNGKLVSGAI
jgi:flagellar biosynthesis/type III secretory pathway chaperone